MNQTSIIELIKSIVYLRTDNESSQEEKTQKVLDHLEELGVKFEKREKMAWSMRGYQEFDIYFVDQKNKKQYIMCCTYEPCNNENDKTQIREVIEKDLDSPQETK